MNGNFVVSRLRELRKASIMSAINQNKVLQAQVLGAKEYKEEYIDSRDNALLEETTLLLTVVQLIYNMPADQKNELIRILNEEIMLWSDRVSDPGSRTQDGKVSSKLFSL